MSGNAISILTDDVFAVQQRLKILRLADNRLKLAWSRTFAGLNSLTFLDLSGNLLTQLPSGTFRYVPRLVHLRLDRNKLRSLDRCVIITDGGLTSLPTSSSSSGFESPSDTSFELESLLADHKDLAVNPTVSCNPSLPPRSQTPNTRHHRRNRLRTLSFTQNPIPCDCRLAWIFGVDVDRIKRSDVPQPVAGGQHPDEAPPSELHQHPQQHLGGVDSCVKWNKIGTTSTAAKVSWGQCSDGPMSLALVIANDTTRCEEFEKSCTE